MLKRGYEQQIKMIMKNYKLCIKAEINKINELYKMHEKQKKKEI